MRSGTFAWKRTRRPSSSPIITADIRRCWCGSRGSARACYARWSSRHGVSTRRSASWRSAPRQSADRADALTVAQPGRVVQCDPASESQIPSHPHSLSQTDPTPQALLAAIVASSDDAIISKTLQGIVTSWNVGAERLFGYTAKEAIGKSITMLIPPDRKAEEEMILSRLRRGGRGAHHPNVPPAHAGRPVRNHLTQFPSPRTH